MDLLLPLLFGDFGDTLFFALGDLFGSARYPGWQGKSWLCKQPPCLPRSSPPPDLLLLMSRILPLSPPTDCFLPPSLPLFPLRFSSSMSLLCVKTSAFSFSLSHRSISSSAWRASVEFERAALGLTEHMKEVISELIKRDMMRGLVNSYGYSEELMVITYDEHTFISVKWEKREAFCTDTELVYQILDLFLENVSDWDD